MNAKKIGKTAVSACLAGKCCRYDGRAGRGAEAAALNEEGMALLICPEVLGGLETPREKAEIEPGGTGEAVLAGRARVLSESGRDVTEAFVSGAYRALEMCAAEGVTRAILKARSPSCGAGEIYGGRFDGTVVAGDGVTAALLKAKGIRVDSE